MRNVATLIAIVFFLMAAYLGGRIAEADAQGADRAGIIACAHTMAIMGATLDDSTRACSIL